MKIRKLLVFLALGLLIIVSACTSAGSGTDNGNAGGEQQEEQNGGSGADGQSSDQGSESEPVGAEPATNPNDVKDNAAKWLAEQMGVPVEEIKPFSAVRATFPDTCLSIPKENETCEEKPTKGWKIFLQTKTDNILVHAYENGTEFRSEELGSNTADPSAGGSKP